MGGISRRKEWTMNTNEALQTMDKKAEDQDYTVKQGVVWGNYSNREEAGVKVQSVTRTYENEQGDKLTLVFDAATGEIY